MRCATLTIIALLCMALHAQVGHYRADFALSDSNFADTIGIAWERGQVIVPVSIDGRPYRFLLDTGAGQAVVFASSALARRCRPSGSIIAHDATGRTDTVPVVTLPPLTLGSITLSGCQATVQQSPGPQRIDGLLGFDLVNGGLTMKIDVQARHLIVSDRQHLFCDEPAEQLRYRLMFHVPHISVGIYGKHRERLLFDTGSRQFISINKQQYDLWHPSRRNEGEVCVEGLTTGRHAMGHYGTEPEGEVAFLELNNLRLRDFAFAGVHTVTTQGGSHIGARLLEYGSVSFCPQHRRMMFLPLSYEQPCRVDNAQMDIAFVPSADGRPQVGLVWEQGAPYRLGFRQGDIIEQIDHRPVTTFRQFVSWGYERGREYTFTLRDRQGARKEVSWVRLPLTP